MKMIEAFKEEMNKSLLKIIRSTIQHVKEMNKIVQDLKMEIEAIKKTQTEGILEMVNLGKRTGTTEARITNRTQEMEERISGIDDMIEEIVHQSQKMPNLKVLKQNIQENWDTMKRPNLGIIGVDGDSQLKGPENIFNKIIEENFPNLKKEMPINVQDLQNSKYIVLEKNSFFHIIIKTPNAQSKERILRAVRERSSNV
jgi:hypothetical protein